MKNNYSTPKKNRVTLKETLLILLVVVGGVFFNGEVYSQNCSVNADIDKTICENEAFILNGTVNGLSTSMLWQQVSGPSVVISNPTIPITTVLGAVGGSSYTFKITAECTVGGTSLEDFVTFTVDPIGTANAGTDIEGCPGTYSLSGNAIVNPGDAGLWTASGSSGVVIDSPTSPTSTVTLPANSTGTSTLTWTISNPNGCSSTDTVEVTNYGGEIVADAGTDQTLSECYTSTQSTTLNGSIGGNGTGTQIGIWSFVTGPSVPTIVSPNSLNTSVTGLIEGTYVFRWTVSGPCAVGSDTVSIIVPAATQDITNANISNQRFCSGVTATTFVGTTPSFAGETVLWTQTGGPAGVVISDPTSPTTQITGLDGSSTYTFRYTITGGPINPGCSSSDTATIAYLNDPVTVSLGPDIIQPVDDTTVAIPVTYSGGNNSKYSIISGPTTTGYQNFSGSTLNLNLTEQGTYTIRVVRQTTGNILTDCGTASDDINVTISLSPTDANAGTDVTLLCDVTTTGLAGNIPTQGVGFWSQMSGPSTAAFSDQTINNPTVSGLVPGVYTFRWSITGGPAGTDTFDDMQVFVGATIVLPANSAGADNTVCFGSYNLEASPLSAGENGLWTVSPIAGVIFSDNTSETAVVSGLTLSTVYTFTWTVSNICGSASDDVIITTTPVEGPSVADAGAEQCLATGALVTLNATIPVVGVGNWSLVTGPNTPTITDPSLVSTTVTGTINGTYEFLWTVSGFGCDPTTDTVLITIADSPTANAGDASGNESTGVCGPTAIMNATAVAVGSGLTGAWVQVSGNGGWTVDDVNSPTATFSNLAIGNYEFQWLVSGGGICSSSSDNVTFTVNYAPTVAAAGGDQIICDISTATLAANTITDGIGVWTILSGAPNNPTITNPNNPTTTITGLVTGTYTLRWTSTYGANCSPSFDDVILQVSAPVSAGADQNLCAAVNIFLQGNEDSSGTWSLFSSTGGPVPVITTTASNTAAATVTPGFDYVFQYTSNIAFGCPSTSDTMNVVNSALPLTPDAGSDQDICTDGGNAVTMAGNGIIGDGVWTQVSGPNTSTIVDNTNPNTVVNNLIEGLYIFEWNTGSGNCGSFSDVVRINAYDPPSTAVAGVLQGSACQLSAQLDADVPVKGIGIWTLTTDPSGGSGIVIDSPNNPKSTLTIAGPSSLPLGTYTFTWTVANGPICAVSVDTVDLVFTAGPPSPANAGPDQDLCDATSVVMNGNIINPGIGTWSQVTGPNTGIIADTHDQSTIISGLIAGTYEFMWSSNNGGCTLDDTVEIKITNLGAPANAGPDQTLAQFDTINLGATAATPLIGEWLFVSGPTTPIIIDVNDPNTAIAGTVPGVYEFTWSIANGVCATQADNVIITIIPVTDLSLTKSVNNSTPNVGSTITFTVAVTNSGGNDATGIAVKDNLPIGYSVVSGSISNGGIYNSGGHLIDWSGINLLNGNSTNLTYQVTVNAATGAVDEYLNSVEIFSFDQIDTDSTPNNDIPSEDDQDTEVTSPTPIVNIALNKTINNTTPLIGSNVVFTITVSNSGPSNATGVQTVDQLPTGYSYIGHSASSGTYSNITGLWNIGAVTVGNNETLEITASVNASGNYTNGAEITATTETDSNSTPNNDIPSEDDQDSVSSTPVPVIDLSLAKVVDNGVPNVGDAVVFTVTVLNSGPSTATDIDVYDLLPSGYSYVSSVGTVGSYVNITGSWVIASLLSGNTETLAITATVNATGDYTNIAEIVSVNETDSDSLPGNNDISEDDQDEATTVPTPIADLVTTKTVDNATPNVGDTVTYTITVVNNGPSIATDVSLTDALPVGVTYASYTATGGTINTYASNVWTIGELANASSATITISATVDTGEAGNTIVNTATAATGNETDPVAQADPTASITVTSSDLSLLKVVDNSTPNVGDTVTFTLTLLNSGPSTATNISIDESLPSGYSYVSHVASGGNTYDTVTELWNISSMSSGSFVTLTITATVNVTGDYTNVAEVVSVDQEDIDSTPNNGVLSEDDQAAATTIPVGITDLVTTKTVDNATPNEGDTVTYTLTVVNNGPSAATSVSLTDNLPAGVTYVSHTAIGGTVNTYATGVWTIGTLPSGSSSTITISAIVDAGTGGNIIINTAITATGNETDPTPQADPTATITVTSSDLVTVKTVSDTTPDEGATIVYTLTVTNNGSSDATGVI
ncbi:MAG: DUF11 domain-containing protein, partial [Lutibacter sp.]|nr:DUF11 domain-containing protein [Lutibacter sp.]